MSKPISRPNSNRVGSQSRLAPACSFAEAAGDNAAIEIAPKMAAPTALQFKRAARIGDGALES